MTVFAYRDGELHAEGVRLSAVAADVGTPFYCYSDAVLTARYAAFAAALEGARAGICFAVKANPNIAVIRTFAMQGAGADVVSGGELRRALAAGVAPERIVFSGVAKTESEMRYALEVGIGQFNVESEPELAALSRVAAAMGRTARVAIRINPDIDAATHAKIATGHAESKFGIDHDRVPALYRQGAALPGIAMTGLAVHIGSQLTRLEPFRAAFRRLADLTRALRAEGLAVTRLDLGGGLGVDYDGGTPPPRVGDYVAVAREATAGLDCELLFEPGRWMVAEAGLLVARVIYVKDGRAKRFVIVDAGMNDLLRPAMYDAYHPMQPVREPAPNDRRMRVEVVGPICETGDVLARDREAPPLAAGDLVAFGLAGAYGAAMASTYNSRPLAAEVLIKGTHYGVIRPRLGHETFLCLDRVPPWLA